MNRITVARAVFLKDLRLLWPLAAITAGLILTQSLYGASTPFAAYLPPVSLLTSSLFVLGLVQQDAPASLRHDWLTRPIPILDLLLAKATLAAAVVVAPAALGAALSAALEGAPVDEALLAAFAGIRGGLMLGFLLLVMAAVTSNLLEAVGLVIGLFLLVVVVTPAGPHVSDLIRTAQLQGSGWVVFSALGVVAGVGGLVVLWLQYGRRSTTGARGALGATVAALALVFVLLNWNLVFAVQQFASPADAAQRRFSLARAPGCLDASWLDRSQPDQGRWSEEQLARAGVSPLIFRTAARPQGLPPGWRMFVTQVDGQVIDRGGASLRRLWPPQLTPNSVKAVDGRAEAQQTWFLPREDFLKLAPRAAALKLRYRAALAAPAYTAEIPADGRRHRLEGLGACVATPKAGSLVEVSCFKAGRQPDLLAARPAGAGEDGEVLGGSPSFAPDLLQLAPGQRHRVMVRASGLSGASRITITAYEARAHVQRFVTVPQLLGGPSCRPAGGS